MPPHATLSLNLDRNVLAAALPALAAGQVGAVEWSFDALNDLDQLPEWFAELLTTFAHSGRLVGHGIFYSVCRGDWTPEQADWLARLRQWRDRFPFDHVTEHFGFLTGRDFHRGAPVAPPFTATVRNIARDRLLRLADAAGCPVGLENLALAYHRDDVLRQGEFLAEIIRPTDGFLLLDAHNLYCQAHNFGTDARELCRAYPLDLVREIHLSGGSWEAHPSAPNGRVRRDTHDDGVPEEVFDLLAYLLPRCPALRYVTLEQLGTALGSEEQQVRYRKDFARLRQLLATHERGTEPMVEPPNSPVVIPREPLPAAPLQAAALADQQRQLSDLLERSPTVGDLRASLHASSLAGTDWRVEAWSEHMLDTVWRIARKWA